MQQPILTEPDETAIQAFKFGYREVRYHSTERERQLMEVRANSTWHHGRPWSVLICAMGYHWKPGSWQKVVDMMQHTQEQGFYVAMVEIMDRCLNPYYALGAMRNEAIMKAKQGFEWILYVDNDVLPEPDCLLRLLNWDMPIVSPYVREPGTNKPLHGPQREEGTGLQPIRWSVLSMLLMRTSVFNIWPGGEFWNDSVGADEGYHFQKLWDVGHRPWIDTNILLPVYSTPTYPLAVNRMGEAEAKKFWDKRRELLNAIPDRAPINLSDPRQQYGEYMPWMEAPPTKAEPLMLRAGT